MSTSPRKTLSLAEGLAAIAAEQKRRQETKIVENVENDKTDVSTIESADAPSFIEAVIVDKAETIETAPVDETREVVSGVFEMLFQGESSGVNDMEEEFNDMEEFNNMEEEFAKEEFVIEAPVNHEPATELTPEMIVADKALSDVIENTTIEVAVAREAAINDPERLADMARTVDRLKIMSEIDSEANSENTKVDPSTSVHVLPAAHMNSDAWAHALDIVRMETAKRYGVTHISAADIEMIVNERAFIDRILLDLFAGLDAPLTTTDYSTNDIRGLHITRKVLGVNLLQYTELSNNSRYALAQYAAMKRRVVTAENKLAEMDREIEVKRTRAETMLREVNNQREQLAIAAKEQTQLVDSFMAPASESPFILRASYSLTRTAPDAKKTEYQDKRRTYYIGVKKGAEKQPSGLYKTPSLTIVRDFAEAIRFNSAKDAIAQLDRIRKFVAANKKGHAFIDGRGKNIVKNLNPTRISFDAYNAKIAK